MDIRLMTNPKSKKLLLHKRQSCYKHIIFSDYFQLTHCAIRNLTRNSRLNSEDSFPRQRKETITPVARQWLGEPLSATVNPGYRSIAGVSDTTQI
jgi:hypothetical protein